jgi:radical SAM superfamily enzyme YgiQ (UPF0313 family)
MQPPLGILYIASFLCQKGIDTLAVDLNIRMRNIKELTSFIQSYRPTIVGLSSNFSNRKLALELATFIRKVDKKITVVVGGAHPTVAPQEYSSIDIDFIIPFEAEKTMFDFVVASNRMNVKGVFPLNEKNFALLNYDFRHNLIDNLDDLPFPAYDMIDIRPYYINTYKKRPLLSMITSRGCPQSCIFCSQSVSGKRWRARSPENVIDEMKWLKERIGAREISIEDDNFTFDSERVHKICDLMQSKNIKMVWQLANGIRADKVTRNLLKAMKDAGCWKIAIAPEVGDEESLKKIKKGITMEQFRRVAQWCKELGIVYYGFFLMGFPFQDTKDMKRTINFAIELDPLLMDLSKIIPFPGTELYESISDHDRYKRNISYYYRSQDRVLERMYKTAYLKFYLRLPKLFQIFREIGLGQFFALMRFGIRVFLKFYF